VGRSEQKRQEGKRKEKKKVLALLAIVVLCRAVTIGKEASDQSRREGAIERKKEKKEKKDHSLKKRQSPVKNQYSIERR
jgi:hypothetical protein